MTDGVSGWEESMVCTKCFQPLSDCVFCFEDRLHATAGVDVPCEHCYSTGYRCGRHEGRWQ